MIVQFAFLCFPPSWLKEEVLKLNKYQFVQYFKRTLLQSMKTATAVYESNWQESETEDLRRNMPFLIINCQRVATLSGGGMFVADRQTFVQVTIIIKN